ncbi:MAG: hypothetical protein PUB22_09960 [Clostridiales bacterium]|nr:hypothetical protein [Clostridiales bacterium]
MNKEENRRFIRRLIIGILAVLFVLEISSRVCLVLQRNDDVLKDNDSWGIFQEAEDSIDVIAIGDSGVYSSISPLDMWNEQGITAYVWSEPSQRIHETYFYLKRIYSCQSPKVVMIDVNQVFQDPTDSANLDSQVKAVLADWFPVFTYHKYWKNIMKYPVYRKVDHSVTKGFFARTSCDPADLSRDYMKKTKKRETVNEASFQKLTKCIDLCQSQGSQVLLVAVPSRSDWDYKKHNAIEDYAKNGGYTFLDLNEKKKGLKLDWETDTADGGNHLNIHGAVKVSKYLGKYLTKHYDLRDRRKEMGFSSWDEDWEIYQAALEK